MVRMFSSFFIALNCCVAMNTEVGLAGQIDILDPKISIARAGDVAPPDFLPKVRAGSGFVTAAAAEAARNEPVVLIEFSSNSDLRLLAKKYGTIVIGRVYLCSKTADSDPTFSADILADELGWILPKGGRFPGPPEFPAPAGRYILYVGNESTYAINLRASEQPVPSNAMLETLTEDLCTTIEAYDFDHPLARSRVMRIPHDELQDAWKAFVSSGGRKKFR